MKKWIPLSYVQTYIDMYRRTHLWVALSLSGVGQLLLVLFLRTSRAFNRGETQKKWLRMESTSTKGLDEYTKKKVIRLKNKSHSKRTRTHEMRNMGPAGICTSISPLYMIKSDRTFVFNMCTYARTHALLYSIYCCAHVVRLEACCDQRPNTARTTAVRYALYICVLWSTRRDCCTTIRSFVINAGGETGLCEVWSAIT